MSNQKDLETKTPKSTNLFKDGGEVTVEIAGREKMKLNNIIRIKGQNVCLHVARHYDEVVVYIVGGGDIEVIDNK